VIKAWQLKAVLTSNVSPVFTVVTGQLMVQCFTVILVYCSSSCH